MESRKRVRKAHFVFLLVTLLLAFFIRRKYPDMAPYHLRTTATAYQPLSTIPDTTRAAKVLHAVTNHLEGNLLLVHYVTLATMVHGAPPPPLRPGDPPMNPVSTATYKRQQPTGSPYHRT